MKIDLPEGLYELARIFEKNGARLYAVGGCVRNALLDLPYSDIDICSSILPNDANAICAQNGLKSAVVNKKLGTIHIEVDGQEVEYTAFRRESYPADGSHDPISVTLGVSMKEDALRRDFSVNSLYYDLISGEVIDPTGKGLSDIAARRLSTTTEDPSIIMKDDALRMLRLCRFSAQLGFTIDKRTAMYVREHSELLDSIARERVFSELCQILLADTKYGINIHPTAHVRGLLALYSCGLFKRIFPEFELADELGKSKYHAHNVLLHCIYTCGQMPSDLTLRFAGLLHDIGKASVYFENGNMHDHDEVGEKLAYDRLIALKAPKKLAENVSYIVRDHMYDLTGAAKESTVRRHVIHIGEERFKWLITMRRADVYGSGRIKPNEPVETADKFERILINMHEQHAPFTIKELAISGNDILKERIAEGRMVGLILNKLLEMAAVRPKINTHDRLLKEAYSLSETIVVK